MRTTPLDTFIDFEPGPSTQTDRIRLRKHGLGLVAFFRAGKVRDSYIQALRLAGSRDHFWVRAGLGMGSKKSEGLFGQDSEKANRGRHRQAWQGLDLLPCFTKRACLCFHPCARSLRKYSPDNGPGLARTESHRFPKTLPAIKAERNTGRLLPRTRSKGSHGGGRYGKDGRSRNEKSAGGRACSGYDGPNPSAPFFSRGILPEFCRRACRNPW